MVKTAFSLQRTKGEIFRGRNGDSGVHWPHFSCSGLVFEWSGPLGNLQHTGEDEILQYRRCFSSEGEGGGSVPCPICCDDPPWPAVANR